MTSQEPGREVKDVQLEVLRDKFYSEISRLEGLALLILATLDSASVS